MKEWPSEVMDVEDRRSPIYLSEREGGETEACTSQRFSKYKLHTFHSHSL